MPYITSERRRTIDHQLVQPMNCGELTYEIQQCLNRFLQKRIDEGISLKYQHLAECLGALNGARFDFENRLLHPYEARAKRCNGDCWGREILDACCN